ncbi:MAG: phosphoribosylformylglycinamidine cyclo-ligase [Candidatus Sungbacteria bacterium]|uniref:Phosphoribosylformylglycinamidine cyclo-ligase n=1 Tax=Candidatus Sungiibacteriota bacterium TaxID=2750080 RepID=A0A9D6QS91_9BACT|nr:phosphoribosylformylglycinamidine cyclo-ligase [Candidatus Sungbacteria bacterium]
MSKISYQKAGVDFRFANKIVPQIKKLVKTTRRSEVIDDIGPFAALFQLQRYREPVLVSSADGVGNKLSMALALGKLDTIGIDLVAMNVNDVLAMGAEPLFFLDYIGLGKDQKKFLKPLIKGMVQGCQLAGCALIGGETAEMPGVYGKGKLGFAGFVVGVVEKKNIVDGKKIRAGDIILGLASSGIHANGFSLVNKMFKPDRSLLSPTKIYVSSVLKILRLLPVRGLVHVTGGGFFDNISRILPKNVDAHIKEGSWPIPRIFKAVQQKSKLTRDDMFHIFNMGIGFLIIFPKEQAFEAKRILEDTERAYIIGKIEKGNGSVIIHS